MRLLWPNPKAVHAGIEFEPNLKRMLEVGFFQRLKLFNAMHCRLQFVGTDGWQVGGRIKPFQQQDGLRNSACP